MLEVARGAGSVESFRALLAGRPRAEAGDTGAGRTGSYLATVA